MDATEARNLRTGSRVYVTGDSQLRVPNGIYSVQEMQRVKRYDGSWIVYAGILVMGVRVWVRPGNISRVSAGQ